MNILDSVDIKNPPPHLEEEPLRSHELLMELRDISSMAIDHFEEKISPALQNMICEVPPTRRIFGTSSLHFQCKYLFAPPPVNDYRQSSLDAMVCDFLDEENRFSTLFSKQPPLIEDLPDFVRPRRIATPAKSLSHRHYVKMERKVSGVMRKVRIHLIHLNIMPKFDLNIISVVFQAQHGRPSLQSAGDEVAQLQHSNRCIERPSGWSTSASGRIHQCKIK